MLTRGERHEGFLNKCSFKNHTEPPKHVLHLVCIVLGIFTAIKTAWKVAFYDLFDGPPAPLTQGQAFPSFVYRIILGPPKKFLHLVCIVLGISTAIKTALKVTDRLF